MIEVRELGRGTGIYLNFKAEVRNVCPLDLTSRPSCYQHLS